MKPSVRPTRLPAKATASWPRGVLVKLLLIERKLVAKRIDGAKKARRYSTTCAVLGTEYAAESPIARIKIDSSASAHRIQSRRQPPPLSAHTAAGAKAKINGRISRAINRFFFSSQDA